MTSSTTPSHLIVPSSGYGGNQWPSGANFTQGLHGSLSVADWTVGNEGYAQQTFLGASIRNFNMQGGFGDSSSSLTLSLVVDEYNRSDMLPSGVGDDVYHNGVYDRFAPPPVGTPVFFKFGKNHATIPQAYLRTMDELMSGVESKCSGVPYSTILTTGAVKSVPNTSTTVGYNSDETLLDGVPTGNRKDTTTVHAWRDYKNLHGPAGLANDCRGYKHLVFGGILQSYTQNRGPDANPAYSVVVQDPREILSNVVLVLNNYAGTTYNNKNMMNIYGFLQHDPSDDLLNVLKVAYSGEDLLRREWSGGLLNTKQTVRWRGSDMWVSGLPASSGFGMPAEGFPITGEGFARRSPAGIPWYRVKQAFNHLFQIDALRRVQAMGFPVQGAGSGVSTFPNEFIEAGYGGFIDFRGFKYVVDFRGIPVDLIPNTYYLDFDEIDLMSLCQELCDVISHDFHVQLLPVIDHELCDFWYKYNEAIISLGDPSKYREMIHGIIRVDAIDRSKQPQYGSVKRYIDTLPAGLNVTNEDIGFELSNVVTDKFVAGAQKTDLYFFTNNKDRDNLQVRKKKDGLDDLVDELRYKQWYHETALHQQILPFYGFLGKDAVTIPRGWGSYQQIQLDTTGLFAHGVGNYYIATELELRAAAVSYDMWKKFLITYNDTYLESMEEDDGMQEQLLLGVELPPGSARVIKNISSHYGVSVPRCVFESDVQDCDEEGLPVSPSSPPYGYPLYYKRAERIGIPECGVVAIQGAMMTLMSDYAGTQEQGADEAYRKKTRSHIEMMMSMEMKRLMETKNGLTPAEKDEMKVRYKAMQERIAKLDAEFDGKVSQIRDWVTAHEPLLQTIQRLGKQTVENSYKVYNFLKDVADKHLGKTFLVKIPQYANTRYADEIRYSAHGGDESEPELTAIDNRVGEIEFGPFGFDTVPINSGIGYRNSPQYQARLDATNKVLDDNGNWNTRDYFEPYLIDHRGPMDDASSIGDIDVAVTYDVPTNSVGECDDPLIVESSGWMRDGALKTNYNPITEAWAFNYQPDPKGGFLPSGQYGNVIMPKDFEKLGNPSNLPLSIAQKLFPTDPTNFVDKTGRMLAYVRYNNSHLLSLHGIAKNKFAQEEIGDTGFIPDPVYELDNTKEDMFHEFKAPSVVPPCPPEPPSSGEKDEEEDVKSIAFVACTLDPRFYMPAKTSCKELNVFGRAVEDSGTITQPRISWNGKRCAFTESYGFYTAHFVPDPSGGYDGTKTKVRDYNRSAISIPLGITNSPEDPNILWRGFHPASGIIKTEKYELDSGNVYALITMPGRIEPTKDARFMDGPYQRFQGTLIKHYLTMDTVDPLVRGFDLPDIRGTHLSGPKLDASLSGLCASEPFVAVFNAFAAYKETLSTVSFGGSQKIQMASSSPVYPDMVALPLMSMERCYGPWISSEVRNTGASKYKDIGGKLEFIKEETLAPWNYAGYDLLNEAGELKAKFSNSLLLFSERGGFSFPDVPSGVSLCQALIQGGPLVTDISVSIGEDEIKTTFQMDLYTSRFGKLDKQKEIALAGVVRLRQKQRDERNALIRNGMGKHVVRSDYHDKFGEYDSLITISDSMDSKILGPPTASATVITAKKVVSDRLDDTNSVVVDTQYATEGTTQTADNLRQTIGQYATQHDAMVAYVDTFVSTIDEKEAPVSNGYHPKAAVISTALAARWRQEQKHYNPDTIHGEDIA